MTHCDHCKGEIVMTTIASERPFKGGVLSVTDIPARECDCGVNILLPNGVLVDGYKRHLEHNGIIGNVTIHFEKLKERFQPMDFIKPHLSQQG